MIYPNFYFKPTSERKYLNIALKVRNKTNMSNARVEVVTDNLNMPIAFMIFDEDYKEYKYFLRGDVV